MDNLVFSLNATVPVFLLMILGLFFRKIGWIDDVFAGKMNHFVFMVPLPVLVFKDLATADFRQMWDAQFVLFCFGVTAISIAAVFVPVAIMLGFRQEKLVAILVMLGSATTVSSFVMAKNMGHEGVLTSGVVAVTTFFSAFTLTFWLYILKSMGLL